LAPAPSDPITQERSAMPSGQASIRKAAAPSPKMIRIAGDKQHALDGPGGDEAQGRDQAQDAARAGCVEVKGGYWP